MNCSIVSYVLSVEPPSTKINSVPRFFFRAEDGIRDVAVTGVQTCALPIWAAHCLNMAALLRDELRARGIDTGPSACQIVPIMFDREIDACRFYGKMRERRILVSKIGRASCRERVDVGVAACPHDNEPAQQR